MDMYTLVYSIKFIKLHWKTLSHINSLFYSIKYFQNHRSFVGISR
jgi:hypothetical protein